jgi:hypothetical protein
MNVGLKRATLYRAYIRGAQFFQKGRIHFKIMGVRRGTSSKFHSENPQILGDTVQNLVATTTMRPCAPLTVCAVLCLSAS